MLTEMGDEVVVAGHTRQRRVALRRQVRGVLSELPLYRIDEAGRASPAGVLALIRPDGCYAPMEPLGWPELAKQEGWWDGLPYPIYEMRPQGYLGRRVARALSAQLRVSEDPQQWSDDDVVMYLSQHGRDQAGNLVAGDAAMQEWSRARAQGRIECIAEGDIGRRYVELATEAIGTGVVGSSAGGEFPKFTAARQLAGAATPHVIVKFSGADDSPAVRRWSDLLVCEHLALNALAAFGYEVARSRIVQAGGRTFLESERFDRHGDFGRSALASLSSVEAALIGAGAGAAWPDVVGASAAKGLFRGDVLARVEELHWFGRFIANTDMHHSNLSFRAEGGELVLAPAYDMLPMAYAPLRGGEVAQPTFPPNAFPAQPAGKEAGWSRMLGAASYFWNSAAADARISAQFRAICAHNAAALDNFRKVWNDVEDSAGEPKPSGSQRER